VPSGSIVIPAGRAHAFEVAAGQRLRIETPEGGQVAYFTFRGFHQALTRRMNGTRARGPGSVVFVADVGTVFYDGAPEPVLELVANRSAALHDLLFPGCQRSKPGAPPGCRDLLSDVLGIPLTELPAACSLFMHVVDGKALPSPARPGDVLELRALRDVTIGVTACPGPTSNSRYGPIHAGIIG
jgi:uncharacterized protein YcgI (DUF1989 family)